MPHDDYDDDRMYEAQMEAANDEPVHGYCCHCKAPVHERVLHGRRTWQEGQIEPDEYWLECSNGCGELGDAEILSDPDAEEETNDV